MAIDLVRIALVLLVSRLLLASVSVFNDRHAPMPETSRKLMHVAMGLLALTYPWVFDSVWPVVMLSTIYLALLLLTDHAEPLRRCVTPVMRRVDRPSLGEYYFPVTTAALFALARGDALLYCTPLLLLTVCDAAAAVVGTRFGRRRYRIGASEKSLEGSAAFFASACVVVALALSTSRTDYIVPIALTIALSATFVEAACSRGLDNLFVPLGAFMLLRIMT